MSVPPPNPPLPADIRDATKTARLGMWIIAIGAARIGCSVPRRAVNSVPIGMRLLPVLDLLFWTPSLSGPNILRK